MNLIDAVKAETLTRKLDNGLTEVKELHTNGQLWRHYFLDKKARWQGEWKSWRHDGTIYEHSHYRDDILHGEYKTWWCDGELWEHCYYENGEMIKNYLED